MEVFIAMLGNKERLSLKSEYEIYFNLLRFIIILSLILWKYNFAQPI